MFDISRSTGSNLLNLAFMSAPGVDKKVQVFLIQNLESLVSFKIFENGSHFVTKSREEI